MAEIGTSWKGSRLAVKAPNSVIAICATVVICAILGAVTALSVYGKDATELSRVVNTLFNIAGLILGGGAMLYSGAAAKRSDDAANAVNGELDGKIQRAVTAALNQHKNGENADV